MLRLLTPATFEPITLDEAKRHLKIDHDSDDLVISALVTSARVAVESFTLSSLVRQSWRYSLDFTARVLELPFANPLVSVDTVGYYATDGTLNVLGESAYGVDTEAIPGRLFLNESLSVTDLREFSGFFVEYTAGPGTASDVPQMLKWAVLIVLGHFYEHREALDQDLPQGIKALLTPYRILTAIPRLQVTV